MHTLSKQTTLIGANKHTSKSKPLARLIGILCHYRNESTEEPTYNNIELQIMSNNSRQIAYLRVFPKSSKTHRQCEMVLLSL